MRADIVQAFTHLITNFDLSGAASPQETVTMARAGLECYGDVAPREPITDVTCEAIRIGSMDAEWIFAPGADLGRRLLHIHGGGLIGGSLSSHRPMAAELARRTGFAVLHIAYRLAPENIFPAAHDDCAAAYGWMEHSAPGGITAPATRMFISGDSAGGNLAVATCARAIKDGGRIPDALALLCPTLDNTDNPVRPVRASDPVINANAVAPMAAYAAAVPLSDPWISTLYLPDMLLAEFPPTLIQASAAEFLLPDSLTLSARLTGLDRRHVLSIWPALPHVWHAFVCLLPEAKAALAEAALFLATPTKW